MQYVSLFLLLVCLCIFTFLSFMCNSSGKAMSNLGVSEYNDNEDNSEFWFLFSGRALHTAALTCILYGQGKWSNRFSSRRPSMISTATNSRCIGPAELKGYSSICMIHFMFICFPIIRFSLFTLKYSRCEPTREDCSVRQLHLHKEVLCYK